MSIALHRGLAEVHRKAAARLYWQAFSDKLGKLLGPDARGCAFVDAQLDPHFCVSATDPEGALLGVCGYKSPDGAFVDADFPDLRRHYGPWGATWRALPLWLLERTPVPGQLLMDGICVASEARGRGVGSALIGALAQMARETGHREIRLDVIDSNPRAMQLYQRLGFELLEWHSVGPFSGLFGFRRAATMILTVDRS